MQMSSSTTLILKKNILVIVFIGSIVLWKEVSTWKIFEL